MPRNLASALSVEAAELLEHFVWTSDQQMPHILKERRAAIMAEVADIAILLTYLAHDLSIDLEAVVSEKMAANERKYPLAKSYGSNKKYTDLWMFFEGVRTNESTASSLRKQRKVVSIHSTSGMAAYRGSSVSRA